jgi:hypothetical protein
MKNLFLLAVGLALLLAVTAQEVTRTIYNGNDCTGALVPSTTLDPNPFTAKVGVCVPEPNRDPTQPGTGFKIISCDGKTAVFRTYLNDNSKLTSSCLRQDPSSQDQILTLNVCYAAGGPSGSTGSYKITSTCNTPVTSGSGSFITVGFLTLSLFLSSVVAALIL